MTFLNSDKTKTKLLGAFPSQKPPLERFPMKSKKHACFYSASSLIHFIETLSPTTSVFLCARKCFKIIHSHPARDGFSAHRQEQRLHAELLAWNESFVPNHVSFFQYSYLVIHFPEVHEDEMFLRYLLFALSADTIWFPFLTSFFQPFPLSQ